MNIENKLLYLTRKSNINRGCTTFNASSPKLKNKYYGITFCRILENQDGGANPQK